jgi:hypothetical protein
MYEWETGMRCKLSCKLTEIIIYRTEILMRKIQYNHKNEPETISILK